MKGILSFSYINNHFKCHLSNTTIKRPRCMWKMQMMQLPNVRGSKKASKRPETGTFWVCQTRFICVKDTERHQHY